MLELKRWKAMVLLQIDRVAYLLTREIVIGHLQTNKVTCVVARGR